MMEYRDGPAVYLMGHYELALPMQVAGIVNKELERMYKLIIEKGK